MRMCKEFIEFLKEYKIHALAIAFIIGIAANQLIKSLVDNILMPVLTAFIPNGAWQEANFAFGPVVLSWGKFLGDLIYFLIIALVVFMIAKFFLKEEKVTKK